MKKLIFVIALFSLVIGSTYTALAQEAKPAFEPADIVHPVPKVPIILDGKIMAPEEIVKFNGQELYYLVNEQAKSEGIVYIFTTLEGIQNFTENMNSLMSDCTSFSRFYRNTSYGGGSELGLSPGYGFNFVGSLSSWNNDIESVKTTSSNVYTKLFDNTGWSGSQLWLATCGDTPNLDIYGWNNRAGSVTVG